MLGFIVDTMGDVRRALRTSARQATLSVAALLTIALGLGATSAILSVVRAALLQPLPYEDADRLVLVGEAPTGSDEVGNTSMPALLDWRAGTRAFSGFQAYDGTNVAALMGEDAEMIRGWRVTPGFLELLGVRPEVGGSWADGDSGDDVDQVVVSHRLAIRLGGGTSALGKTLVLGGTPNTIIGVMPRGFHFGDDADVWMPLQIGEVQRNNRAIRGLGVIARIRDGVDPSDAYRELVRVTSAMAVEHPAEMQGRTVAMTPVRDALLGNVKAILVSLSAAVAVLLVITVANLAALTLLRNLSRTDELALRAALGASRGRLVRQLFVEGLVLAIAGALLSVYVGGVAIRLMLGAVPDALRAGMPYLDEIRIDLPAVVAVFLIAAAMAVAFALAPAWRTVRAAVPVGHGVRMTAGKSDRRVRRTLVVAQLGLTVVLLIGTGQLAASFAKLVGQESGIEDSDRVLTMSISLAGPAYPDDEAVRGFYEELVARTDALPGVVTASAVNELPLSGSGITTFERVDVPTPASQREQVAVRIFAGDLFGTLGVPAREGRLLGPQDRVDTTPSAVVSASFAERVFRDRPALGRRIRLARTGDVQWEIVGIVDNVQMGRPDSEPPIAVYLSHLQAAENRMPLVVRTAGDPASVAASVREVVRSIDPTIPLYSVATLGEQLRQSRAVFVRRFPLTIGALFAVTALLLAVVGLYTLCAHEVTSRRREFTIRQVVGASPASVRIAVLRDGLVLILAGVVAGVLIAVPASQLVRSLLFGVRAVDPWIYGGVALGVVAASLLATALPAWRGSPSDLAAALRSD